jgi:hypothetical protein
MEPPLDTPFLRCTEDVFLIFFLNREMSRITCKSALNQRWVYIYNEAIKDKIITTRPLGFA